MKRGRFKLDSITRSILHYISLPQTNYAIQLTGAWGTGKTHFVINDLKNKIENIKSSNKEGYKFCYVSLNGFSSVDEIGEAVFLQMTDTKNQFAVQGLKLFGKYGNSLMGGVSSGEKVMEGMAEHFINKIKSNTMDSMEHIVICFDDLERIDDSLSIKQVFGYINTNYIEHQHVKVIFISNEEEIHGINDYKLYREKVIGKSLKFKQSETIDLEKFISSIYKEKKSFIEFFEKEKTNLLEVINFVYKEINLRTLRFTLDTFVVLQSELYKFCSEEIERNEISKSLFLNTLVIANEYKKGDFDSVNQLVQLYSQRIFYYWSKESKGLEEDYTQIILKRYHRLNNYFDQHIHYFASVSTYLINGYVDNKDFERELTSFINTKRREDFKEKGEENAINILSNFRMYDEDKVRKSQDEVLKRIKENYYSANEYPDLYRLFYMFSSEELLLTSERNIEQIIESGFTKALESWKPEEEIGYWDYKDIHQDEGKFEKIIKMLQEKRKEVDYLKRKEKLLTWLEALANRSVENEMYKDIEHEDNLFTILLELNFVEEILLNKSNQFIVEFTQYLHHKYLRIGNANEFYSHETSSIETLIKQVDNYLARYNQERIKKYNIEQFNKQLREIRKHIEKRN